MTSAAKLRAAACLPAMASSSRLARAASCHPPPIEVLDLSGYIVLPGLINTHHHFYQTLTRAVPAAQNANLFNWLKTLYPIWARMTPEDIFISTQTALAELALSGCTTASDHLYLFPNGSRLDDEIAAAREVGLRLHASRGSMSLGESQGGLPPDSVVDSEERILADSQRLIERYHDPKPGSMLQIVLAPCSPFSVTGELMRQSASLAREYGVHLHTHLAETQDEEVFCLEKFGYRPAATCSRWIGSGRMSGLPTRSRQPGRDRSCLPAPAAGWRTAPARTCAWPRALPRWRHTCSAGVKVGLGVDGSASNDGSHLLAEARQAMLLARLSAGAGRRLPLRAGRPAADDRPPGAGAGHARRGGRAGARRPRLAGAGQMRRFRRHPPEPPGLRRRAARPGGRAGLLRPAAGGSGWWSAGKSIVAGWPAADRGCAAPGRTPQPRRPAAVRVELLPTHHRFPASGHERSEPDAQP